MARVTNFFRDSLTVTLLFSGLIGTGLIGCTVEKKPVIQSVYYEPINRQLPLEATYSRLTWAHLPQPAPVRSQEKAPYLSPVMHFELTNSNLSEAIEAISQTIGYRAEYPRALGEKKVSLNIEGTAEDALREIERQTAVRGEMDHHKRVIKVRDEKITPEL